ncbi:MAG TPA: NADH-quinone oxidoreductase subunit NuoB [Candidatus Dormibacteraeota bacterium]|jgi:formate hydrogenlyase subunit 7|nr:NADH-quinone oxidoreductase subunit NuoB [Candidatus Dormibacteraeota bacterium]
MSRWIVRGLRTGVRTTIFPAGEDPEAGRAPSAVELDPGGLTPPTALAVAQACPTEALVAEGNLKNGRLRFDLGQCILCGRCTRLAPEAFRPVHDPRVAVRTRDRLSRRVTWSEGGRPVEEAVELAADRLRERSWRVFGRSLHIRHLDAGSCNGCESELQLLSSPHYDLARLGLFFTPTPRHADALLVTGVVTRNLEPALRETYEAIPEPKLVVAAGVCAIGGGCFTGGIMTHGPLDRLLPVDVYVPGCPPTPLALLHGLLLAVGKAEERRSAAPVGERARPRAAGAAGAVRRGE